MLACKKIKYSGKLNPKRIGFIMSVAKKDYFKFDKVKGWLLANKGQMEFSRLKQFI